MILPKFIAFIDLDHRLKSFRLWRGSSSRTTLADAGFFWLQNPSYPDCCVCYWCGLELEQWCEDDNPWIEHAKRRPDCPHLLTCWGRQTALSMQHQ